MGSPQPPSFGELLRRQRVAAGLTQEQLAERAGLSARGISDLERGVNRTPQPGTLLLLAEALRLSAEGRAEFEAAARRHSAIPSNRRAPAAPPPLPSSSHAAPPGASLSAEVARPAASPSGQAPSPRDAMPRLFGQLRPLQARSRLVAGLLVIALLVGTLLSGGAAVQHPGIAGGTICLATDFPTTGSAQGTFAKPLEHAVNLAVTQNRNLGGGYTLKAINYDDTGAGDQEDPTQGASDVTNMVRNACIVGMVGPFNGHTTEAEMPIAANAGLAMISPTNTNPGLTLRPYASETLDVPFDQLHPAGKKTSYFRTIANDAFQEAVDADFTFDRLAAHRVYVVVSRPSTYGDLLVGGFTTEFLAKGGTIIATETLEWHNPAAFAPIAARIAAAAPDAVYFAGTIDGGGPLLKQQLVQQGYTGPFVGPDGIGNDPGFIAQAGAAAAQNSFVTVPTSDISTFTAGAAAKFLRDYHARYPGQPVDGYCAQAYDAAMVLITAIRNLIRQDQAVTRAAVIDQVQNIQYTGVTGVIAFDKNGDIVHGLYTVYAVQDGSWVAYTQLTV